MQESVPAIFYKHLTRTMQKVTRMEEKKKPEVTSIVEDYLGVLLTLERDQMPATGAVLAKHLSVSPPTVTNTFKRMKRDGLILMDEVKKVHLTDFGREIAESVMRRHMLTEWWLEKTLNVPWSETHLESHDIEHALSKNIEKRLQELIKTVKTCPHGNPLPGYENYVQNWTPLSQFQQGEQGILRRIHEFGEDHSELLKHLEQHEFFPGVTFTVKEVLPFNQTMTIDTAHDSITLGLASIKYLFAERS